MKHYFLQSIFMICVLGITEVFLSMFALAQGNELLVIEFSTSRVLRYNSATGTFIDELIPAGSGGLNTPQDITLGPDGNIYISSWGTGSVKRYQRTTGDFLGDFIPSGSGGLANPDQLLFGPDGHLYVSDRFSGRVLRYDELTGASLGTFVQDGRLSGFVAFTFGPDGNLYASMFNGRQCILRYNGQTGAFMNEFACASDGSSAFSGLAFGADGHLYASRYHHGEVWQLDRSSGQTLSVLHCPGDTRSDYMAFGPDGYLYVSNLGSNNNLSKFNVQTGDCLGTFFIDGPVQIAKGFIFATPTTPTTPVPTRTSFQVNPNGFSFKDYTYITPTWELFKATFPNTDMELPDGTRRQGAVTIFNEGYFHMGQKGSGAGLSIASVINYLPLPETVERNVLSPEHRNINLMYNMPPVVAGNVTGGQSDVKDYIHIYTARQIDLQYARWFRSHINDTVLQTYQEVKTKTAHNEPVAIKLFTPDQLHTHRMTAYRTEESGNMAYVYVYDPNWPNDATRRIDIDLTRSTWQYTLRAGKVWSNTMSFYAFPASVNFPAEIYMAPNNRSAQARATNNGETRVMVNGNGQLLITDSQGRKLGYDKGQFVSHIPDAVRLLEENFNPDQPDETGFETFFLPAGISYIVAIYPVSNSGNYTLTTVAVNDGTTMSLSHVAVADNTVDTLMVNGGILSTTFKPATDANYCQTFTYEETDSSRSFDSCVTGAANQAVSFGLNNTGEQVTISNGGTQAISVTTTIDQVGAGATTETVTTTVTTGGSAVVTVATNNRVYLPLIRK